LGHARRAVACLGRARWSTASRGRSVAAAASCAASRRGARADLGCADSLGSAGAIRTDDPRRPDMGSRSAATTAAAGARPIVGSPGSSCAGGASGPHLGLARTRAITFGAASTTLVGCAQAHRPTAGRGAVMGQ